MQLPIINTSCIDFLVQFGIIYSALHVLKQICQAFFCYNKSIKLKMKEMMSNCMEHFNHGGNIDHLLKDLFIYNLVHDLA